MSSTRSTVTHPINHAVDRSRHALREARDLQPTYLSLAEKEAALRDLAALESEAAALRLRVTAAAGDLAEDTACRDVAAWQASRLNADLRRARADQRLAHSLDADHPAVAEALAGGRANLDQARVVVEALDALPDWIEQDTRRQAELNLVRLCARHSPSELRHLGRAILDHVAPEVAEAAGARRLQDEEASAWKRSRLTLRRDGDGTTRISGLIPDSAASRLRTYLEAFTSPRGKPGDPTNEALRVPHSRRLAHAFVQLLERTDPSRLPEQAGDATTVIVTMTLEQLRSDLATATLLDLPTPEVEGRPLPNLSAGEARRLACAAKIVPAVLGNRSEVLDLGRADRLFRPAQRKALRLRDRHCRAEGCTVPATWCDAHHRQPWSQGGRTDLADGVLLCPWHHHRVHDPDYEVEELPGRVWRVRKRR
ncbi:HNH endonuclease signature motif containing protein [Nocardioides sambongensis]|uniref:HNH endonuclease signature motif containing protein n=1 Tax=Nocardioides sambongensis TaxID=2589074 RepID=UPI0015E83A5F|nr:HNH endonuclease signature motif containing protein [Nocardioides sambongensis]